jgi:hypothetical protein
MMDEIKPLSNRISRVEIYLAELSGYLHASLDYVSSDPQSSLTKCRIVLEKVLRFIYAQEMLRQPTGGMVGNILSDKDFIGRLPRRMLARMNAIRDIANLGPHGGEVEGGDAIRAIRDLVDVLEWFVSAYDVSALQPIQPPAVYARAQTLEILPQLRSRYSAYLRPNITSVKLGQLPDRCFLETTTMQSQGDLYNETSRREDLGFIANEPDDLFFDPARPIYENAERFVSEFDEISIINCTDLFTEAAATMIYDYWAEYGVTPTGRK